MPGPDQPFCLAVFGQFSARGEQPDVEVSRRIARLRPILINRDNFNDVMARLGVQCDAAVGDREGHAVSLRFGCLDDFHPDSLFRKTPLFAQFKQLREKLLSPVTFDQAAAEVRSWGLLTKGPARSGDSVHVAQPEPEPPASAPLFPPDGAGLLDQSIAQTESGLSTGSAPLPRELAELVRSAARPLRVDRPDPEQDDLVACVDSVASQLMRSILHDPRFQSMEAAWRGLAFLVHGLPTGAKLKIFLCDVSLAEIAADFGSTSCLEASGMYKLLVEQSVGTAGGTPWSVIACNYTFDAGTAELLLAALLARVGCQAGAPVLAAASPQLIGCDSLAATPDPDDWRNALPDKRRAVWEGVRGQPEASHLGLGISRFLLRMPYGRESQPIEGFAFEEVASLDDHGAFLWGNPAFACAYMLGRAFHEHGWRMRPQDVMEVGNLPVFGRDVDGEYTLLPCAEALLSDRAASAILDAGLMPLVTIRGTGTARLAAWRSASGQTLSGPWE